MALILMAVWDTVGNACTRHTVSTLYHLEKTVDWSKHRMIIIDNGSVLATKTRLLAFDKAKKIWLPDNIGQAQALNLGLAKRKKRELVIKMDNDVVIRQEGWIEDMEYALEKDPSLGIVALKRRDAWEHPTSPRYTAHKTHLEMLQHHKWDKWMVVEISNSIVGTCIALRPEFLDKIGSFYQMGRKWGFIDPILCTKAKALMYRVAFLPHVDISYLGSYKTPEYKRWAYEQSVEGKDFQALGELQRRIIEGGEIYHEPRHRSV